MARAGLIGLALAAVPSGARAQMDMSGTPAAPDGATLFRNQCAACHANAKDGGARQGPNLYGVIGRKAGSAPGFHYSGAFAKADFTWDKTHLDAWLTNPQAVLPGTIMMYRQAKAPVRQAIIQYLGTPDGAGN